jgi:hypothetical protein
MLSHVNDVLEEVTSALKALHNLQVLHKDAKMNIVAGLCLLILNVRRSRLGVLGHYYSESQEKSSREYKDGSER